MDELDTLTQTEQLLLMAAAVRGLHPGTNIRSANTARIVDQALRWMGLSDDQIRQGWEQAWASEGEVPSLHEDVYNALVRMTYQHWGGARPPPERPGEVLFEGGGNRGVPGDPDQPACWPHFNSCRLTAHGEQIARVLLERHPEYREVR